MLPTVYDSDAPTTAGIRRLLVRATEVVIIEESPDELDGTDAARLSVTGSEIAELARRLAIIDGGMGDHCLCLGWPTILLLDARGVEFARWTLHHEIRIRAVGNCDADLLDGPGLADWLADHGLTGMRQAVQDRVRQDAELEERRIRWVRSAPPGLTEAAESVSRREDGAEQALADLVARSYPDVTERIRTLAAWAGMSARNGDGGWYWYELVPQQMLLPEPTDAIFHALTSAPLTAAQLDGAAELFTCMKWTRPIRAEIPEPLRSTLITHVSATGTEPMKFRMRHGYGRVSPSEIAVERPQAVHE
jgi:hypothetical protein